MNVEILKIGSIMPVVPIKGKVYDTSQFRHQTIMVVFDGGLLFDHYVSILKKTCSSDFVFLKTAQSIVGYPFNLRFPGQDKLHTTIKGISDGSPIIDKPYTINNGGWYTSKVTRIVEDCIIITKNSVYAIHEQSEFRDKIISNLID